jgi:hypothetical protein
MSRAARAGMAPAIRLQALVRGCRKRLVDVPEDVVDVLEADREPHHVGRHAGGELLGVVELAVRRRCRRITRVRVSPMLARWLMAGCLARTPQQVARAAEGEQPEAPGMPRRRICGRRGRGRGCSGKPGYWTQPTWRCDCRKRATASALAQ